MQAFKTSGMPEEIFRHFCRITGWSGDGFGRYEVGCFVTESAEDPDSYDSASVEKCKALDVWFISQGAHYGETILVE